MCRNSKLAGIVLAVLALSSRNLLGQEADATEKAVKPLKVVDAQRQIKFEISDAPIEADLRRFPQADFKQLLDQKFVAEIHFQTPTPPTGTSAFCKIVGQAMGRLQSMPQTYSLLNFSSMKSRAEWRNYREYFTALQAAMPKEKRIAEEDLRFFLDSADLGYFGAGTLRSGILRSPHRNEPGVRDVRFYIIAPTQERAKELSKVLLELFDYGISVPAQHRIIASRETEITKLNAARVKLTAAEKAYEAKEREYDNAPLIDPNALADFRLRHYTTEVDVAGARARIEAIHKLLAKRDEFGEKRQDQLEELKIAAEVELAGLAARKKALAELIHLGEQRSQLEEEKLAMKFRRSVAQGDVSRVESVINNYDVAFDAVAPLPCRIDIVPINWLPRR